MKSIYRKFKELSLARKMIFGLFGAMLIWNVYLTYMMGEIQSRSYDYAESYHEHDYSEEAHDHDYSESYHDHDYSEEGHRHDCAESYHDHNYAKIYHTH